MAADTTETGRRWWVSIGLGAVLCVGCCLIPILAAAGIMGGGALLVSVSWLEPVGFGLLALGAAGLVWSRIRSRRRGCAATADGYAGGCGESGCGCTPPRRQPTRARSVRFPRLTGS
ncbi:hypothetical protein [Nocardia arizonensis]|uniref:hypothetical protein n=1 Tax=Nocardia arizonensis TaxID=1141647 RepID=UPI000A409B98|nr:hypothetical protein [Nocardia arizonensis]